MSPGASREARSPDVSCGVHSGNKPMRAAATYSGVVGMVLVVMRKSSRMRQADMAREVGLSASTWSRIEGGSSALNVDQLSAAALGVTQGRILSVADDAAERLRRMGVSVELSRVSAESALGDGLAIVGEAAIAAAVEEAMRA